MSRKKLKTQHKLNDDGVTMQVEGVTEEQKKCMEQHGINLTTAILAIARKKFGMQSVGSRGEMREDHAKDMMDLMLNAKQDVVDIIAEKGLNQVNLLGLCALLSEVCGQQFALGVIASEEAKGESSHLFDPALPQMIAQIMEGGFLTGLHGALAHHDTMKKPQIAIPTGLGGSGYKH